MFLIPAVQLLTHFPKEKKKIYQFRCFESHPALTVDPQNTNTILKALKAKKRILNFFFFCRNKNLPKPSSNKGGMKSEVAGGIDRRTRATRHR